MEKATIELLHRLRNPHGLTDEQMRADRLEAADKIEELAAAYLNMRQFAHNHGLDTAASN